MTNTNIANTVINLRLKNYNNYLNVAHVNICSLYPKINYIKNILSTKKIQVFCVSETWLSNLHTYKMTSIMGFNTIRHDRKRLGINGKTYGGICMFTRQDYRFKIISKSGEDSLIEFLFVEIKASAHDKILVGVIYNPPPNVSMDKLYEALEAITPLYSDIIITGDFNINMMNINTNTFNLRNNLASFDLEQINNTPTHFKANAIPSCLDLFFVLNTARVLLFDQTGLSITHHDLIFISYDIKTTVATEKTITYRDYKQINISALLRELYLQPWYSIFEETEPEEQVKILNHLLTQFFENNVPFESLKLNNNILTKNPDVITFHLELFGSAS